MIAQYYFPAEANAQPDVVSMSLWQDLERLCPEKMPYAVEMRLYLPPASADPYSPMVWRLDAYKNGSGADTEILFQISSSTSATRVAEPRVGMDDTWRELMPVPGIALAPAELVGCDGSIACGTGWLNHTVLRLSVNTPPASSWTATLNLNIVTYPEILS